jgi:hypothetical protein
MVIELQDGTLPASPIKPLKPSTVNGSPRSVLMIVTCVRLWASSAARRPVPSPMSTEAPVLFRVYGRDRGGLSRVILETLFWVRIFLQLMLDPNTHARLKVCRLSVRVKAQAKRVAVMVPDDPLGLPGSERSERP